VAGIIGGNGYNSSGNYMGVAPQVNLINVKVSDDTGNAAISDVVNGLQWVFNNAATYNIRVVNLSLNSTVADSYQVDPLDAAVETLWNAGIVVVVSAGNNGTTNSGVLYAPADDPFAITVGAVDDLGTVSTSDDTLASFSAYGTEAVSTTTGLSTTISKPDLVAPGVNITSVLASSTCNLAVNHPLNVVNSSYFTMSGTSMAAPVVAGAAALLLQANPSLTPGQVKYILTATATPLASSTGTGTGEVNAAAAVTSTLNSTATVAANGGLAPAASIQAGDPAALWGSASWGSASWGSTTWTAASWGSASWGSASWGSASWGSASWGSDFWGKTRKGRG
jgi:serine protease AprX